MSLRRLIFTMLAVVCMLLPTSVSAVEAAHVGTLESVDPIGNRPQWRDIGMCDVLAVTGGGAVAPPTAARPMHDSPTGFGVTAHTAHTRHYGVWHRVAGGRRCIVSGYIYLIRCLRL
ncbi:MAG: hypothetical protein J6X62_01815 [Bacteroidales bacterium]|nr:hypothetical protein [Bacteroidales bacterium]